MRCLLIQLQPDVKTDTEAYGFLVILTVTTTAQLEMIADDLTQAFPLLAFQQCGAVRVPVCVAVVQKHDFSRKLYKAPL